jgi:histidine phosphotransferase ChpT
MAGPEITLIGDSVTQANARIRLYRIAFGIASAGQLVGRQELVAILSELTVGLRLRVEWAIPDEVCRAEAKLAVLLLMCMETALPFGGTVQVSARAGGWQVSGESLKLRVDPALWRAFAGGTLEVTAPAQVQFALALIEAETLGRKLAVTQSGDRLTVSF